MSIVPIAAFRRSANRLLRQPAYCTSLVAMLALGIGIGTAIFALVSGVLLRPLPYPESDRLVAVRHTATSSLSMTGLSPGLFLHYRGTNHVFEELGFYSERLDAVTAPGEAEQVRTALVSPSLFTALRARPYLGRFPEAGDVDAEPGGRLVRSAVLISQALWRERFGGDPGVLGRSITVGRFRSLVVVGVAARGFGFPHPETQVWIGAPPEVRANRGRASLRSLSEHGVGRLRPGLSPQDAERDLERLIALLPEAFPDVTPALLQEIGLRPEVVSLKESTVADARMPLLLLTLAAGCLLLITWANATNLALVRAHRLRREIAIQYALGAGDRHIVSVFLAEAALLATAGGAGGLLLAYGAVAVRFGFALDGIPRLRDVSIDAGVLTAVAVLSAVSALLLGALPAWSVRRASSAGTLAAGGRTTASPREQRGRRMLVAAQIALALPLLTGSALLMQSIWRLTHVDLGFEPAGAVTFTIPVPPSNAVSGDYYRDVAAVHAGLLESFRALPGVARAEAATIVPLTNPAAYYNLRIAPVGQPNVAASWRFALWSYATPGYFDALGIPVLAGRTFTIHDMSGDAPGVVLGRALARELFGEEDPIGRRVFLPAQPDFPPYAVVGVVGDVAAGSIQEGVSRIVYFPHVYPPAAGRVTGVIVDYIPDTQTYILRTALPAGSLLPAVRQIVARTDPRLVVVGAGGVEDLVADSFARVRLVTWLLIVAAGTALFLGMAGLYGVLAYMVGQRSQEFGVRMALGARPADLVWMVTRQGAWLALAGSAVGSVLAAGAVGSLRSLLYGVSAMDPVSFALTPALMLGVALLASYVPARRAARTDPVRALRSE